MARARVYGWQKKKERPQSECLYVVYKGYGVFAADTTTELSAPYMRTLPTCLQTDQCDRIRLYEEETRSRQFLQTVSLYDVLAVCDVLSDFQGELCDAGD